MKTRHKSKFVHSDILWAVGACAFVAAFAGLLVGGGGRSADGAGWETGTFFGAIVFVVLLVTLYVITRQRKRR